MEIVYSPSDALKIAESTDKPVVFPAIGFETTIPVIAATVLEAKQKKINNFMLLVSHKVVPPALDALMADPEVFSGFKETDFRHFIISRDNYTLFYKNKNVFRYIQFFNENYLDKDN